MKTKLFLLTISLFVILPYCAFSQNNSTVIDDVSSFVVFSRPRVIDNEIKSLKTATLYQLEKHVFELINDEREASGLKPLVWSDDVARVARLHSQNMAKYKFFDHQGLDGLRVSDRADLLGIRKWMAIGENIAFNRGYASPDQSAVESWMKSTGHRKNILNIGWKETGIGIALDNDGAYYFTQVFLIK